MIAEKLNVNKKYRTGRTHREARRAAGQRGASRRRGRVAARADHGGKAARFGFLYARRPIFRFLIIFMVLVAAFYAVYVPLTQLDGYRALLGFIAEVCTTPLAWFGYDVTARGELISSPAFSLEVIPGCDGFEATALFIAAVLASPVSYRLRCLAISVGTLVMMTANLVRIISMFLVGSWSYDAFEVVHIDVWQPLFVLMSFGLWVVWALWAVRRNSLQPDV